MRGTSIPDNIALLGIQNILNISGVISLLLTGLVKQEIPLFRTFQKDIAVETSQQTYNCEVQTLMRHIREVLVLIG